MNYVNKFYLTFLAKFDHPTEIILSNPTREMEYEERNLIDSEGFLHHISKNCKYGNYDITKVVCEVIVLRQKPLTLLINKLIN